MVAQSTGQDSVAQLRHRIDRLAAFYAPLGTPRVAELHIEAARALVAIIDLDDRIHDLSGPAVFGSSLPPDLATSDALLNADDAALRRLTAPLAAVATSPERVRIVAAGSPPTMLYEAHGSGASAWASHAVAAAYVATGKAELNAAVLPEFLAAEFVGGERTLIRASAAVETATEIELSGDGSTSRSYWPPAKRWELLDAHHAQTHAEDALLRFLPAQLSGYDRPFCGITGGLDSRVAAVALARGGVKFEGLTFGEREWPDVQEAPAIAAHLGVPHRGCPIEWTGDDEALRDARAAARWHEGAIQLGIGRIAWPEGMSAWVTGGGGETGRAFYYREAAQRNPAPSLAQVTEALSSALLARLGEAEEEARDGVRRSADRWIGEALSVGADGWRALDVVYAEQRLRRWLRGMLTHEVGATIPAFGAPEVQRGLVSLPLSERVTDGFHHRFLARYAPELNPAESAGEPPARTRRALDRMRRVRRRPVPSIIGGRWTDHPRFRAWIGEEVLRSPALAGTLGERWCRATREGFLAGDGRRETQALWAAGPLALEHELEALNGR